jgi:histidinol dehydrogenase
MLRLDSRSADFDAQLSARLAFEPSADAAIEQTVAGILADVRGRGDAALLEYTRRFDRLDLSAAAALELSPQILRAAVDASTRTISQFSPATLAELSAQAREISETAERRQDAIDSQFLLASLIHTGQLKPIRIQEVFELVAC